MPSRNGIPVIVPFNPLDKRNLGESVADAALHSELHTLPPEPFIGAGVYLLYFLEIIRFTEILCLQIVRK